MASTMKANTIWLQINSEKTKTVQAGRAQGNALSMTNLQNALIVVGHQCIRLCSTLSTLEA